MNQTLRSQSRPPLHVGGSIAALAALALLVPASRADIVIPGADGSDGALNITSNTTIDLSQAPSANWDTPSPQPGKGVYDGVKWAVVFKYSSVNIASGATVTFKNNASRAPVVWLVNGNVTIGGTVNLDGALGGGSLGPSEPGPGGFRGGAPYLSSSLPAGYGFGPGGPLSFVTGGSFATKGLGLTPGDTYGNTLIVPLLGGSGGAPDQGTGNSAGAGGGAILIAAASQFILNGAITAVGGFASNGHDATGSGGSVRVIASSLAGSGSIQATGGLYTYGPGGDGRVRLEALTGGADLRPNPSTAVEAPMSPLMLWPPDSAPSVRVVSVGTNNVPIDPKSSLGATPADIHFYSAAPMTVTIETKNVDPPAAKVTLRVGPKNGAAFLVNATYQSGSTDTALWTAQVTVPQGFSAMQPRVDPK